MGQAGGSQGRQIAKAPRTGQVSQNKGEQLPSQSCIQDPCQSPENKPYRPLNQPTGPKGARAPSHTGHRPDEILHRRHKDGARPRGQDKGKPSASQIRLHAGTHPLRGAVPGAETPGSSASVGPRLIHHHSVGLPQATPPPTFPLTTWPGPRRTHSRPSGSLIRNN